MEGVNPFIKNNKHRMIMFLDELGVRPQISTIGLSFLNKCLRCLLKKLGRGVKVRALLALSVDYGI